MTLLAAEKQAESAVHAIRAVLRDALLAVYLYGSARAGGLKPDSDLDLFAVIDGPLAAQTRRELVEALTPLSARAVRPPSWRPLELTVVQAADIRPWRYPPRMEFLFGEWMRSDFERGVVPPGPRPNRDLAVVAAMVRAHGRPLLGPPPGALVDDVPRADVRRASVDTIDGLLEDLGPDTRNVLLTLARMWHTVATDRIVSKDEAADWALHRLDPTASEPLALARAAYLGDVTDDWTGTRLAAAARLAAELAARIREAAQTGAA